MKKVLLYSGGTDSWLIDKIWKPDIKLYVNIEGIYSKQEIDILPKDVKVIDFSFLGTTEEKDTAFVPLRNLYFLMLATNYGDTICYGATKGDRGGRDNRPRFIDKAQSVISYCLSEKNSHKNKNIKIEKRFAKMDKFQLVKEYLKQGGSIEELVKNTFSCHTPCKNKECMQCKPCYRKFLLAYYFGYKYPDNTKREMISYLKENVIPLRNYMGTYFTKRTGEGKYMKKAVNKLFKEYGLDWRIYR